MRVVLHNRVPHPAQVAFLESGAKRKIVRAGRRGGKTTGMALYAVRRFLQGKRVLYTAPTADQVAHFWKEVKETLQDLFDAGLLYKHEGQHVIEWMDVVMPSEEVDVPIVTPTGRIRAKTAWSADSLRGDFADVLIFDEWQLCSEDAWDSVGAPMLLDNNGEAIFIYTPPSLQSRSVTKARDPQHAAKLFKRASQDTTGRWATFHFTSFDNPHISAEALAEIAGDMTALAYRQEIKAEDVDEAPGALWTRQQLDDGRVLRLPDGGLAQLVVAVDPSATSTGDEAGIIVAGMDGNDHRYVLEDCTVQGSPLEWARAAVAAYHRHRADQIVAESNQGGEMVRLTIHTADPDVPVRLVHASRGKQTRAAPISALYEKGMAHHVGSFPALEDELCLWVPGDPSPNRLDALVWGMSALTGGWKVY